MKQILSEIIDSVLNAYSQCENKNQCTSLELYIYFLFQYICKNSSCVTIIHTLNVT